MEGVTNVSSLSASLSDESMSTMKRVLTREGTSSDIHLLVVGRTGQGKSTLINSLIELAKEVAKEGAEPDICTKSCHSYVYPELLPGVRVRIVDSPGLQDIYANEQKYIQEMKSQCQEVSVVLYCMKMTDHRISNDDKSALRKLNQAFGPGFWKRVLFVLTFANNEKCDQMDNRDEDGPEPPYSDRAAWENLIKRRFVNRVKRRGVDINMFLKQDLKIDDLLQFVPAGHYKPSYSNPSPKQLPDRGDWLYDMIESIHSQMKKNKFSRLNLNDKIHLALIVDNHGEVKIEKNGTKTPNDDAKDAQKFRETLEDFGFCTLYFNSLSSQSISTLLEMLLLVDHSQLAMFSFIVLCKGKSRHLYDCNDKRIDTENVFGFFPDDQSPLAQVPKIFYFHLVHTKEPKEKLQFLSVPRKNSVVLITSTDQKSSSVVLNTVGTKLKNEPSIQQCCKEIDEECNRRHDKVSCVYISNFTEKFVLPAPFEPFLPRAKKEYYKKQLEMYRSMWYPIRCKTINVLSDSKDAVLTTVHSERIGRIAASSAGVAGGGLVIAGLALIPFTLGGSIFLSVVGSAVGGAAALGGIGAFAASAISTNKHLKSAQEHISLDQQLSQSINVIAKKYNDAVIKCNESALERGELAGNIVAGGAHGLANLGRVGVGIAFGVEAAAEVGAVALRTGARAVGVVLAGASLAVTVPIDLGFIIYHSYQIHQSSKDKTGKADRNKAVQWFIKRIEDMLKDTCTTVELQQHTIKGGKTLTFEDVDCGYEIIVPAPTKRSQPLISTLYSLALFICPMATLLSVLYMILYYQRIFLILLPSS